MQTNSLKTKVLLWFTLIISLIMLIFSFTFYYLLSKNINLTIKTELYKHAIAVKNALPLTYKDHPLVDKRQAPSMSVAVEKGATIIKQSGDFNHIDLHHFGQQKKDFYTFDEGKGTIQALYILRFTQPFKGVIYVYKKDIDDKSDDTKETLLILNPILMLLLILTGSLLIDKILRPIKELTHAINNISVRNFTSTIPLPKKQDEMTNLINSFNTMIQRLKDGVEILDRFNSDVSHELKTPLTVIKGETELSLRKERSTKEYKQSLQTINYEASQIQSIVTGLLLLTKYTQENIADSFHPCILDEMLCRILDKYRTQIETKQLHLQTTGILHVRMYANPTLINAIFSNLIDNAIKYSKQGGTISVSLSQNDHIHFRVEDEGIGIAQEEIQKITQRFYRVDPSRDKRIHGFGLGLAIVENSIKLHNGTLKIDSIQDKGTIVEVTF